MKRLLAVLLALALLCGGMSCACAEYYSEVALIAGDAEYTPEALERAVRLNMIQSALDCAARGYAYDMKDSLSIIDVMSKVLFDLEMRTVVEAQAQEMGLLPLTEEEEAAVRAQAEADYQTWMQIPLSENGSKYLPGVDPEAWGLTLDALIGEARAAAVNEKLMQAYTKDMTDADDAARQDAYTDWILERWQDAVIYEDALGVAEVCLKLAK